MPPVRDKADMYVRLGRGDFGNTVPQWLDVGDWLADRAGRLPWGKTWGIRTMTPGGPCRLNCPADSVQHTADLFTRDGHRVQISPMLDAVATVTAWLEVWDSPTGLVVEGIEHPDTDGGQAWRNSMPDPARRKTWRGTFARLLLARHLNENSRDDLAVLLDRYPGHVVELSAFDRCLGTVPHRNGVVWEVRSY